jgi:transposase InsO family protein
MIAELRQEYPEASIRARCQVAGVNRSWFYARSDGEERDLVRRDAIEEIVLEFPGYGYRRVTHAPARDGWRVNHKRVLRVMREESLLCRLKRSFVPTTDSQHGYRRYPNLIKELVLDRPNVVWCADITYIRLRSAFCYLAAPLDAFSRRCVGWELSRSIDTTLTLAALERALWTRRPPPGLIHHSDQGVQYAGGEYVERLEAADIQISMAAKGESIRECASRAIFPDAQVRGGLSQERRDV